MKKGSIMEIINIPIAKIINRASCLEGDNMDDKYHKSYFYFVDYFLAIDELTEKDLVIGANFSYGWMPTILNFKSNNYIRAVSILNEAKYGKRLVKEDLLLLKGLINNSLVGVSKLLHFINPDEYAIWDSRACKFLTGKSCQQEVKSITKFFEYLDICKKVQSAPQFEEIHLRFKKRIGYECSPMRTVEQIMFISSDKPLY